MKKKMLEPRILQTVTGVVFIFFILIYTASILYLGRINNDQEVNNQRKQMERAADEISFWQVTTENLARRIALDEDLAGRIFTKQEVSAAYSLNKRAIINSLATYAHIEPGIQEITIYTVNGDTFSSSEYRGSFVPENNIWYKDFLKSGEKAGFTSVHESVPSQANITIPVITYILPFYDLSDYRHKVGDIFISLEYDSLQRILPLNNDFLKGLCLYNRDLQPLVRKGELSQNDEKLLAGFYDEAPESARERYILRSNAMQDDWKLVYELSDQVFRRQFYILSLYCLLIFGGLLLTLTIILRMLIRNIVRPVKMLTEAADQLGSGNFDVVVDIRTGDELEILSDVFNKMVGDMQTLLRESVENEEIKRKMQVDNLMLQINPHFIYNTLNSIIYMASEADNEQIINFTNAFITLLQNTLRPRDTIYIRLSEELSNVSNYVELQKYRYMHKFRFRLLCNEEYQNCAIPSVVLQPIVENAIFHGIAPMERDDCTLSVKVEKDGENLRIVISDDGVGMPPEKAQRLLSEDEKTGDMRKIGIANVNNRLKEIYGEEYALKIKSDPGKGTEIILLIPFLLYDDVGVKRCFSTCSGA